MKIRTLTIPQERRHLEKSDVSFHREGRQTALGRAFRENNETMVSLDLRASKRGGDDGELEEFSAMACTQVTRELLYLFSARVSREIGSGHFVYVPRTPYSD